MCRWMSSTHPIDPDTAQSTNPDRAMRPENGLRGMTEKADHHDTNMIGSTNMGAPKSVVRSMRINLVSLLAGFILAFGGTAQADCFPSVSLGEYPLGEWSDADRTWVVSDTVGSFSDVVTTRSEAATSRDTLIEQCSTKGNALITKVESRLNEKKAGLGAEFDEQCTDAVICPMIRDMTIESRENEIDREIDRMKSWYGGRIDRCRDHFNYKFNTLSPLMCSE